MEHIISEAKRKGPRKPLRQVSSDEKYEEGMENSNDVMDEIKKFTQLFKVGKDSVLRSKHNAHEFDGLLNGF